MITSIVADFDGVIANDNIEIYMKAVNVFIQKHKGENLTNIDNKTRSAYKNVSSILESLSINWQ